MIASGSRHVTLPKIVRSLRIPRTTKTALSRGNAVTAAMLAVVVKITRPLRDVGAFVTKGLRNGDSINPKHMTDKTLLICK